MDSDRPLPTPTIGFKCAHCRELVRVEVPDLKPPVLGQPSPFMGRTWVCPHCQQPTPVTFPFSSAFFLPPGGRTKTK